MRNQVTHNSVSSGASVLFIIGRVIKINLGNEVVGVFLLAILMHKKDGRCMILINTSSSSHVTLCSRNQNFPSQHQHSLLLTNNP